MSRTRAPQRPPDALTWDLRGYWAKRTVVVITMSERCIIRTIVGQVDRVAATGAFAVVDGWHLPADDVLRVARATVSDRDDYAEALERAQREAEAIGVPL